MLKNDEYFKPISAKMDLMLNAKQFIGRADKQVEEYLLEVVEPIIERYKTDLESRSELSL